MSGCSSHMNAVKSDDFQAIGEAPDDVGKLELPLMLIDLDDLTVSAVSWAALRRLNATPSAVLGRPVANAIPDQDRADAVRALKVMRDGAIDSYRSHRRMGSKADRDHVVTEWVRAFRFGDRHVALAEAADGSELSRSPLAEYLGREPLTMAVGTTDPNWVITSVSTEIHELLGITVTEAVGRRFLSSVEQSDIRSLLNARRRARGRDSVALRLVLQDTSGRLTPACCVLTSLAGSTELCFILMRESDVSAERDISRLTQLEQHLRRIAREVEDSGVVLRLTSLPNPAHIARVAELTDRQSEVLDRLLRGERVPTIAKALFVSQSTVRNHLVSIFKHFGVHSQAELLARLTSDDQRFQLGSHD